MSLNKLAMPYFMNNEEWFYYNEVEECWKLTQKGEEIPKVVESYKQFLIDIDNDDE